MLYIILSMQEVLSRDMLDQIEDTIKDSWSRDSLYISLLVPYLLRLQIQARLSFVVC